MGGMRSGLNDFIESLVNSWWNRCRAVIELLQHLVSCGGHFDSQCSPSLGFDPASDGGTAILEPPITNTVKFSLFD